jgi:Tol biopolymer transport system component
MTRCAARAARLTFEGTGDTSPVWSPDGSRLAFAQRHAGLPLKAQPLLHGPSPIWAGGFSPDGRWLAYPTDDTGRQEIYITRFPSLEGKSQVSSEGGRDMAWRHDGKAIFYLARDGSVTEAALAIRQADSQ